MVFLGDLFDGGREWWTGTKKIHSSESPDQRWKSFGEVFWLQEYQRFGNIFFKHWRDGDAGARSVPFQRKLITSLPGNHDLGFSTGIQLPVRKRFNAFFGESNRVDLLGNHSFVSLDTVSLSAMGSEESKQVEDIWSPTKEFLDGIEGKKKRAINNEIRHQKGLANVGMYRHTIVDTPDMAKDSQTASWKLDKWDTDLMPTILLSHVPLYRAPGTPCGPLREHWPPAKPAKGQDGPVNPDERNAIPVQAGYQYQNVLTKEISREIAEKVGDIRYAFSGDDHDYCEVNHRSYPSAGSGILETTVKSISWAMGVRRPGFEMLSLWNPLDATASDMLAPGGPTMQKHLCLLPDQIGTFIRYGLLFAFTVTVLVTRAVLIAYGPTKASPTDSNMPLLPLANAKARSSTEKARSPAPDHHYQPPSDEGLSKSSHISDTNMLSVRSSAARTRSASPRGGYGLPAQESQNKYGTPLIAQAGYYGADEGKKEWDSIDIATKPARRKLKGLALLVAELLRGFVRVGSVVLVWYFWLLWNG